MADLQRIAGWRLWSVGGPPGWQHKTRQRLLDHLRQHGWQPETLTLREEDGAQPFDDAAATRPMRGPWPGGLFLQGARFDVWLDLGHRSALELRCEGSKLAEVAAWADRLFCDLPPDFAWLAPWNAAAPAGLETALDELQAATGPGRDVAAHGPAGPGLVSWVGAGIEAGLRDAVRGLSALRATPGAGGVLRLDLDCSPQTGLDELLRHWLAARDACTATGWFSTVTRNAAGSETWLRAPRWTPPPRPAEALVASDSPAALATPTQSAVTPANAADRLAAAARSGAAVNGLKLAGLKARAADWSRLRADNVDLQDADLSAVNLSGATLVDCDFDRARLERVRLDGATLDQARLRHAHAPHLSLAGATLTHCFLQHAVLTEADCGGALLRACHAVSIDAERADFEGALLEDVDLSGAHLRGARFVRAVLRGCRLDRADLRDADWTDSTLVDCSRKGART